MRKNKREKQKPVRADTVMAGTRPGPGPVSEVKLLQRARDLGPGPSMTDSVLLTSLLHRRIS